MDNREATFKLRDACVQIMRAHDKLSSHFWGNEDEVRECLNLIDDAIMILTDVAWWAQHQNERTWKDRTIRWLRQDPE
jgi:hypothetical protein